MLSEWEWDERNLAHLARHGLTAGTVQEVAENDPKLRRNKRNRAATMQMVGRDDGGKWWTVCIVVIGGGRWRAVTGWPSSPAEVAWHSKTGRSFG